MMKCLAVFVFVMKNDHFRRREMSCLVLMIVMSHITSSKFPPAYFHQVGIGFHDRGGSVIVAHFSGHKLLLFMDFL